MLQGIVRLKMCEQYWQSVEEPHLAGKLLHQSVEARHIGGTQLGYAFSVNIISVEKQGPMIVARMIPHQQTFHLEEFHCCPITTCGFSDYEQLAK